MFFCYLAMKLGHLIVHDNVIINKVGFPELQLFAEKNNSVILKSIPTLIFNPSDGNVATIIPIRENTYNVKFKNDKFLFMNKKNNTISIKRLKYMKGTLNYDDGYEWKIIETSEGMKLESRNKCIQTYSSREFKKILFIRGVDCSDNKTQLFEIVGANMESNPPQIYVHNKEYMRKVDTKKLSPTINLVINED